MTLPFCVFNGGRDTWLDVGNKRVGVEALQAYFGLAKETCLHVGDQFLNTGNDLAARETCACIWITSPRYVAPAHSNHRAAFACTERGILSHFRPHLSCCETPSLYRRRETEKILEHMLRVMGLEDGPRVAMPLSPGPTADEYDCYTGEKKKT